MRLIYLALMSVFLDAAIASNVPECSGKERWPAMMGFATLKNAGLIKNSEADFSRTRVSRLASENIGIDKSYGDELHRQVHLIDFFKKMEIRYQ